jgi:probable HAF family extracellular repeat protein
VYRRAAAATVVSFGLLLSPACQPDKSLQPGVNRPPIASVGGPYAGPEGAIITFDASGTRDPDGDTLTYMWAFGDGDSKTGVSVWHSYRNNGSYEAMLIVADQDGARDTANTDVSVANAPPVITLLTLPTTAVVLGTPAVIQVAFSDPGALDSVTAEVDWGDQSNAPVTNGTASHTYSTPGNYFVSVIARDKDGAAATRTATDPIVVAPAGTNHPPVARIRGPSTIREGQPATYSARESSDPDTDPLRYAWTFVGFPSAGRDDSIIEQGRYYQEDGVYTIQLVVIDSVGAKDTATATLTVVNTPPLVSLYPPTHQAVGVPASTRFAITDSGGQDTHTIAIRWGDGARDSVEGSSDRWNTIITHTYATAGSYQIKATARDDDGGADSATAAYPVIVFDAAEHKAVAGYDVFDIGTLGGNSATASHLNARGQIVGQSLTAPGATHAFLWEDGIMRDLGTLGYDASDAQRINEAGLIAGRVWSGTSWDEMDTREVLWSGGGGRIVGSSTNPGYAAAVGTSGDAVWNIYGHESAHAWLWRNEVWQPMGAREWQAAAMNDRGQIVGRIATHAWGESRIYHASLWQADSAQDLGVLGRWVCGEFSPPNDDCSSGQATDLNDNGQIVGLSTDTAGKNHFVLWENGTIHDLGLVAAGYKWGRAFINDRGQIVGSGNGEAFVWSNGTRRSLGSLGGATDVVGMNEDGTVVGTSYTSRGEPHVFVWSEDRGMVDLGTGPHGFTAAWAVGINSRGDVIGYTAPCVPNSYDHTCNYPVDRRAILWRNTQATAGR